ncbi:hypothetical protein HY772_07925 [Candidatus Woesearchaeota archaeon]|nr:hypothetical protein [Candidatus Woesearchaeota archaeon]
MTTPKSVCQHCSRPAKNKLTDKHLCDHCFVALCERKLRRNLRNYDLKRDECLLFFDDASNKVLSQLVHIPVKSAAATFGDIGVSVAAPLDTRIVDHYLKVDRYLKERATHRLVVPLTMDDENEEFLQKILTYQKECRKEKTSQQQEKNTAKHIIKLFEPLSRTETQQYCTIKKIPYSYQSGMLGKMLDAFEKKYPGTKTSIARSAKDVRKRFPQEAKV